MICFGVDIGGTTVKLGMFSEAGELLEKWEIPTTATTKPRTPNKIFLFFLLICFLLK